MNLVLGAYCDEIMSTAIIMKNSARTLAGLINSIHIHSSFVLFTLTNV